MTEEDAVPRRAGGWLAEWTSPPLLLALAGLVSSAGILHYRVGQVEGDAQRIETRMIAVERDARAVDVRLATIDAHVRFIYERERERAASEAGRP